MNTLLLFKQMLMLAAMMISGYFAFKINLFNAEGQHQISKLVVNLLNPCILLSSLSGERPDEGLMLSLQDLAASLIYFCFFIAASYLYYVLRGGDVKKRKLKQFMIIFSNLGFFGIPIVKALFGDEYVIYLIFYMLLFNLLAYTLGFKLASSAGGKEYHFSLKSVINTGTVSGIVALVLYFTGIPIPETAATFLSYMGNVCIPMSMILIGGSLAQLDLKAVFTDKDVYFYILVKNLLIPAIGILIFRMIPFDDKIIRICCLISSMPIAALTGMISEQYANEGNYCNKMIAMSTIMSVVTVPLLSLLYL